MKDYHLREQLRIWFSEMGTQNYEKKGGEQDPFHMEGCSHSLDTWGRT